MTYLFKQAVKLVIDAAGIFSTEEITHVEIFTNYFMANGYYTIKDINVWAKDMFVYQSSPLFWFEYAKQQHMLQKIKAPKAYSVYLVETFLK